MKKWEIQMTNIRCEGEEITEDPTNRKVVRGCNEQFYK